MLEKKYVPPTNKAANRIIYPLLALGGAIALVAVVVTVLVIWGGSKLFGA